MVLLGKQLAYFERYGKMYLADVPLLHDPVFFGGLLKAPPLHRGATAVASVDSPSLARPQGA
jgi:hypothetical protein